MGSQNAALATAGRAMILLPYLLATMALIGWDVDSEALKRAGLASVTMNPGSAVAMVLMCVGMLLRPMGTLRLLPALLIGAGGLIGASKLSDLCLGTHFDIDTLLFTSKLSLHYARPSRMAPNTAAGFVLTSLSLLLMTQRSARAVVAAQALAFGTAMIAIFAMVGHLYGISAFYVVGALHPMALHAAVSFLCLSVAVFLQTARRGVMIPISDDGPAGRSARALLPAAVAIPILFGWLRQEGDAAGLFAPEMGVALMVMLTMITLFWMVWQTARWLLASDQLRCDAEARVAHMAQHDFLTGLPNRSQFMDRLVARMATRERAQDASFALLYMDLDGFKLVNDRFGHMAGDTLLREVGTHLRQSSVRRDDLVARVGGDEFAMLLPGISSAREAAAVAGRIVSEMPRLFGPEGREVPIGISIGIALSNQLNETPEALINDADRALYFAKHSGKGRFALAPDMPSAGFYGAAELLAA